MKKNIYKSIIIALIMFLGESIGIAQQQKLAQTGMKFLVVSLDAKSSSLGQAVTSLETNSSAMFYNPAGMSRLENFASVSLGQTNYIADIKYMYGSIAFAPFDGDYGVIGFNLTSVDYGDFMGTIRADNEQGFLDVGTYSPTAFSFGVGYAKALSDKFSVGGGIKYVRQSLGESIVGNVVLDNNGNFASGKTETNEANVLAFDFGILYKTGFKSLDFGMSVRNFSQEVVYKSEGFQLPLLFKIGISFNAMDLLDVDKKTHSLLLAIDASHPRDYQEQVAFGAEYTFLQLLSLRVGYESPTDEKGISAGLGLKHNFSGFDFAVDYAYTSFGIFNKVQQVSIHFAY